MNFIVRSFLIGVGTLSIALGVLGIFLPLLPTTPLLLLGAACYFRSSETLYNRLLANKWLGRYIKDFYEGRGIPLRAKIISITFLWLTMGITILFFVQVFWLRVILFLIGVGVTVFLLLQKTSESYIAESEACKTLSEKSKYGEGM